MGVKLDYNKFCLWSESDRKRVDIPYLNALQRAFLKGMSFYGNWRMERIGDKIFVYYSQMNAPVEEWEV